MPSRNILLSACAGNIDAGSVKKELKQREVRLKRSLEGALNENDV